MQNIIDGASASPAIIITHERKSTALPRVQERV
jgi:hypothetical protein